MQTWLYRITVNTALTRVRSRPTVGHLDDDGLNVLEIRDLSIDLEAEVERDELRALITAGLDQLEPDVRAVVVLRDVEGFSASESSEILEITQAALKSRLHRGRLLLRQFLIVRLRER